MSEIAITNSDWADLGQGPMTVQLTSWNIIYIVFADTKPTSQTPTGRFSIGMISTDRIRVFTTEQHVWAMCASVMSARLIVESGASQTAALDPGTYLTSFFPITLGQKTLVNSMSVALATDHSPVPIDWEYPQSGKTAVTGTLSATGQSAAFTPLSGRSFNASLWGTFVATVRLERSFDSGTTWMPITAAGTTLYSWTAAASEQVQEDEAGVIYRLNCTAYTSGTVNYRISQ